MYLLIVKNASEYTREKIICLNRQHDQLSVDLIVQLVECRDHGSNPIQA